MAQFRGLLIGTPELNLPLSVTDQRGRMLSGVKVTITNPNGVVSSGTTENGGVILYSQSTSNIKFEKDKAFLNVAFDETKLKQTVTVWNPDLGVEETIEVSGDYRQKFEPPVL